MSCKRKTRRSNIDEHFEIVYASVSGENNPPTDTKYNEVFNSMGYFLIHEAVLRNDSVRVKAFFQMGCDINKEAGSRKSTPLSLALENKSIDIIKTVMDLKPRLYCGANGKSYVTMAVEVCWTNEKDLFDVLKLFFEHDYQVHKIHDLKYVFSYICGLSLVKETKIALIEFLLDQETDCSKIEWGQSALHDLISTGCRSYQLNHMVKMFVSHYPYMLNELYNDEWASFRVNVISLLSIYSAGDWTGYGQDESAIDLSTFLLLKVPSLAKCKQECPYLPNAGLNAIPYPIHCHSAVPICVAAQHGNKSMIKTLLNYGSFVSWGSEEHVAEPEGCNCIGRNTHCTPLYPALAEKQYKAAVFLMEAGLSPHNLCANCSRLVAQTIEEENDFSKYFAYHSINPRKLVNLSKRAVRKQLAFDIEQKAVQLEIPTDLVKYVTLERLFY